MTDRPIIFSGPMVRALLAGAKTQTRRLATSPLRRCAVGDRLWVRESLADCWLRPATGDELGRFRYTAGWRWAASTDRGSHRVIMDDPPKWPWQGDHLKPGKTRAVPSIHMSRWASRLTLRVTAVRHQLLQRITQKDAKAEGIRQFSIKTPTGLTKKFWSHPGTFAKGPDGKLLAELNGEWGENPAGAFHALWDSLHGKDGERWEDNPEVVALTFEVIRGNIDQLEAHHG